MSKLKAVQVLFRFVEFVEVADAAVAFRILMAQELESLRSNRSALPRLDEFSFYERRCVKGACHTLFGDPHLERGLRSSGAEAQPMRHLRSARGNSAWPGRCWGVFASARVLALPLPSRARGFLEIVC